jgi:hypothetical protein
VLPTAGGRRRPLASDADREADASANVSASEDVKKILADEVERSLALDCKRTLVEFVLKSFVVRAGLFATALSSSVG